MDTTNIEQDVNDFLEMCGSNDKFNPIIQTLKDWRSEKNFQLLVELCDMLKGHFRNQYTGIGEEKIFFDNLIKLLSKITLSNLYKERENIQLSILCKYLFVMLAEFYEVLGAVGESFDYLILAIRPTYDFNDPKKDIQIESDMETYQKGIDLQVPGANETLLYYCHIYFKVIFILGHIFDEALHTFFETKDYTKHEHVRRGVKLNEQEVLYWCSGSTLLSKTQHIKILKYTTVLLLASLEFRYPDHIKLYIIETLLIHHRNNLSNQQIKQLLRNLSSLSFRRIDKITKKSLQLLKTIIFNVHNHGLIKNSLYDLLFEIDHYSKDPLISLMQRQRQSWIINTLVVRLIETNRYKLAFECAYIWKNFRKKKIDEKNTGDNLIVLIIRNASPDKCWVFLKYMDEVTFKKIDSNISSAHYIAFKNEIESSWVALLEEPETHIPQVNQRPDITRDTSKKFEENLNRFYSLDELSKLIGTYSGFDKIKVFELSTFNAPLQAVLYNKTTVDTSMLITNSTLPEGTINKILLWINPDSGLFLSESELNAFSYLLRHKGYTSEQVIVRKRDECTKAEFLELYSNEQIDLIWISSHGTINSNDPRKSRITISSTEFLELHELSKIEIKRDTKRLLVLNICQSASAYIRYNGMDFLGISQLLTQSNQSVVGHHWYSQYLSSAAFGGVLMFYLMDNFGWSKAVGETRKLLSLGTDQIISKISDTFPNAYDEIDLIQRIRNQNSVELDLIANWGSTSFFE